MLSVVAPPKVGLTNSIQFSCPPSYSFNWLSQMIPHAECRYAECRYAECRYGECHVDHITNLPSLT
jgi:hypothetical protein